MNADEIRNMEAGREMDALVAEKVMGWKWDASNPLQHLLFGPDGAIGAVIFYDGRANDGGIVQPLDCPYYSTDIATAWEVVERILDNAHTFELEWNKPCGDQSWFCYAGHPVYSRTAPLAICRAALFAVMGT